MLSAAQTVALLRTRSPSLSEIAAVFVVGAFVFVAGDRIAELLLRAMSALTPIVPDSSSLRALTAGAVGLLTLGMMARVSGAHRPHAQSASWNAHRVPLSVRCRSGARGRAITAQHALSGCARSRHCRLVRWPVCCFCAAIGQHCCRPAQMLADSSARLQRGAGFRRHTLYAPRRVQKANDFHVSDAFERAHTSIDVLADLPAEWIRLRRQRE